MGNKNVKNFEKYLNDISNSPDNITDIEINESKKRISNRIKTLQRKQNTLNINIRISLSLLSFAILILIFIIPLFQMRIIKESQINSINNILIDIDKKSSELESLSSGLNELNFEEFSL